MRIWLTAIFLVLVAATDAQLLSWTPDFTTDGSNITITMDATYGSQGLKDYTPSDVYVHLGVITNLSTSSSNWKYVKFNQNFNAPNAALQATSLGSNKWSFSITGGIRNYFGVPDGETILKIAILFRNGAGTKKQANADGSDMYIPVYPSTGLQVRITDPFRQPTYVPIPEVITKSVGQPIPITAKGSVSSNMSIWFNGTQVATQAWVTSITASPTITVAGSQRIITVADNGTPVRDTFDFYVTPTTVTEALPAGVSDGANYLNGGTSVTLVLYAPNKTSVNVIGDFNNWMQTTQTQMKKTPDNLRYWVTIDGLTPGQEYAYQYVIDGTLKVADYMTEKVLDPWNDPYINVDPYTDRYPNLKAYPTGKTSGIVSVLEPGKATYNWSAATTNFQRPDKHNIMVYELLVRDFVTRNDFKGLLDSIAYLGRTGVNAVELMPFNEFEGNNSWGYNPAYMFAVDKFYGPENKLREFIDSCHGRGIAVIMDMVLNHQFGSSPMVQMYWDAANSRPASNSPWFNQVATHPFSVGYDFNHEAPATIDFVQKVMNHWLTKYKLDGFRWDLSKGFTQTVTNDAGTWSNYDQSRVNIWQRIYNQSQAISPNCYMILEHLGVDQEEATLANMGMLLWGKMTDEFNQCTMGYASSSDFSRAFHTTRWTSYGGNNTPNLLAYAESHDEERLSYKNAKYGNSGTQNVKLLTNYSKRMQAMSAFLFTIPGPKQMWQFGELAYDSSITLCENYTLSSGCRTSPKPTAFNMPGPTNYSTNTFRRSARDTIAKIIRLRTAHPEYMSTWTTNNLDFSLSSTSLFKWQRIMGPALNLVVIGNFDVTSLTSSVTFPAAGTWYLYAHNVVQSGPGDPFSGINSGLTATQIVVTSGSTTQSFNMPPGSFLLFTDKDVNAVVTQFTFTGNGNWSSVANWQNNLLPPSTLPAGSTITINPSSGECVLDVNQTIQSGATLNVAAGKTFRIAGNLIRQ